MKKVTHGALFYYFPDASVVTNDTVKVEIWDVVDKGRSQKKTGRGGGILKMFNEPEEPEESDEKVLDAGFLDVYKGAHGVVFLYDITKQW